MNISPKYRIRVNLIAFLLISLGLSYAMATQVLTVLQDRYTVNAIFTDAGGVFTNQEVTYRGVTVGQVGELSVVEEGVSIELLVDKGVTIPEQGIEARVMFKSAVGEQFVDLIPAEDSEPYLEDGDTIPLAQTSIPVSTQELLTTLEAVLRGVPPEALKGAVDALGLGLTGTGPDIATILESTADLAELFADRAPEVEGILRHGTTVGSEFLRTKEDFVAAMKALVPVSTVLGEGTDELEQLLRATNLTSDEVTALMREDRAAVNEFLVDFAQVNELQAEHADDLTRLMLHLPTALDRVNRSFEPDTGLVRFGLVTDTENPGCSYGTKRRPPEGRGDRPVPKKLRCGTQGQQASGTAASLESAFLLGSSFSPRGVGGPSLPARMADWSWTLFYLNGI
jgi:phospholipid/cholesterol/gamma-HCH transport system substrate-binding protein